MYLIKNERGDVVELLVYHKENHSILHRYLLLVFVFIIHVFDILVFFIKIKEVGAGFDNYSPTLKSVGEGDNVPHFLAKI